MPTASGKAPRARGAARTTALLRTAISALGLVLAAQPALAQATDRWAADEVEARATLPAPQGETAVTQAALSCAAQRWSLHLTLAGTVPDGNAAATLDVDGRVFETRAAAADGGVRIAVPRAAIEPLKAGLRARIGAGGAFEAAIGSAAFPLRGSRIAITAAQDRCSLRDMSAYTPVTFTPYTSYMNLARTLRRDDIAAFKLSTASEPELTAAMAEFDGGRRVLFTRLCGSSWYYGASGCNITGFAPDAGGEGDGGEGWRAVYDTENVHLHTDPKAVTDGWPDIVTLPARPRGGGTAGPGLIWRWDGKAYALKGELPEDEEEDVTAEAAQE